MRVVDSKKLNWNSIAHGQLYWYLAVDIDEPGTYDANFILDKEIRDDFTGTVCKIVGLETFKITVIGVTFTGQVVVCLGEQSNIVLLVDTL